jgi:uncharacterized 2Fe-2S/4Fe-4S cluster protein (DUF4445 family)
LALNRNRRHTVIFQPSGRRGYIDDGKTILEASREIGVDIESICGGKATCGKCRVRIEEGYFEEYGFESKVASLSPIGEGDRMFLNKRQLRHNYRLACQTHIHGDIVIFVPEESRMGEQLIRKEATARDIKLKPAVKKYYIEMASATLHDTLGDFERLQAELNKRFKLRELTIDYPVLLSLQNLIRQGDWRITVSVWKDKEIIKVEPGQVSKGYGLAVDIGTTTVAGYLCDLATGEVVATDAMMNPQVVYGEDVMSRIGYSVAQKDGLKQMNQAIIKGLNQVAGRAAAQAGIKRSDIVDMTVVGNTCMHHIFLNIDPQYLGKSPFPPSVHHSLDIKARDLGLKVSSGAYVHVLPIEAGFVGADNVGVLIAEEPYHQEDMVLVIDIGTNGELILGNRRKLVSASCATGPAFEGAAIRHGMRAAPGSIERVKIDRKTKEVQFKVIGNEHWNTDTKDIRAMGICGSGIFDVTAQMFTTGIIDISGRFNSTLKTTRLRRNNGEPEFVIAWADETASGHDIVVCQSDIRAVQLAKGAMYAGAKILMSRLGVNSLDRVILAGAFGSYINKESAAVIGLFPDCALEKVNAVGNAAGDGARIALLNVDKRKEADVMARQVEYVELTVEPDFNKTFTQAMWFPHMKDKFPHLKQLLPKKRAK